MTTNSIETLYYGDKRLDNLGQAIMDLIHERVGGQDIPYVSVVGVLELIKSRLLEQVD